MRKKISSPKTKPPKTLHQSPTPADGEPVEMVLIPTGFTLTSPEQSSFRLIATQGPGTSVAGPVMAAAPRGSGFGLPVFTLVPRISYESKLPSDDALPPVEHRTFAYGGHDLIISGSMSDEVHVPQSFTLTPAGAKIKGPSKPYSAAERKK